MGLLAQLFRHKNAPPSDTTAAPRPVAPEGGGDVRGVGAIAAAAGVKTEHGMPSDFALSLGELLSRVPQHCVWPGRHDAGRTVRIPAADVAPGLGRGKAEVSLARLAALAPEVFRWERGEADAPQVRLPIQKLLQQIRSEEVVAASRASATSAPVQSDAQSAPPMAGNGNAGNAAGDAPIVAEQLPPIIFEPRETATASPATEATLPPDVIQENAAREESDLAPAEPRIAPEQEMPTLAVNLPPCLPEARPTISIIATDAPDRRVELRPSKDVAISTTLRAVVLGGIAPATAANATGQPGQILAPRIAPAAPAETTPVILSPSVVSSAESREAPHTLHTAPDFAGLQSLFMTDAALGLPGIATLAAHLPGVRACVISGSAGSAAAGNFSQGVSAEDVHEASTDLARIGGTAMEMLHRGESDIALFLHDEVCVAAVIATGGFVPGVRERLARVAELLAGAVLAR